MLCIKMGLIDHLDVSRFLGGFLPVLPVQNCPSVSIQLDGGDNNVAGVDTDGGGRTV